MFNTEHRIFVSGNVAVIEVFHKKAGRFFYTLVDSEDIDFIKEKSLYLSVSIKPYTNYVMLKTKEKRTVQLHRLILNTPSNLQVDHRNHNGLDNRKSNIRNVTPRVNQLNKRKSPAYNPCHWWSKT